MNVFVKKMKVRDLAIPPVTFNLNTEAHCSASRGGKVMQFDHNLGYISYHISFTLSPMFVYCIFFPTQTPAIT